MEWVKVPIDQDLLTEWITPEDVERTQACFRDRGGYLNLDIGSELVFENNVYGDYKMVEEGKYQQFFILAFR